MSHIANGYSDAEIDRIAQWFSSRSPSANESIPYEELGKFQDGKFEGAEMMAGFDKNRFFLKAVQEASRADLPVASRSSCS